MSFHDIIGHRRPIQILKNAVERGKIPSSYLFSGIEGIGKKYSAITLAKTLNCNNKNSDCCDQCLSCKKIDHHKHPDIRVTEPVQNTIKIDQIRSIKQDFSFRPFEGNKKVLIIDEAEKMNHHAANSLLKTLEEPPLDTLIVLITSHIHLLLPTIISRCQRVNFNPLSSDSIFKILKNNSNIDDDRAYLLASLSEGSAGKALAINQGELLAYRNKLINKISAISHQNFNDLFQFAEELNNRKDELIDILETIKTYFRDLVLIKEGCFKERIINMDLEEELIAHASKYSAKDLLIKLETVSETQHKITAGNINKKLALESMLFLLCNA